MPFFFASSISLARMGREALEMSISPRPNFLKPPPVPETPTVTLTSGCSALNSSATASVIGYTVLDPSIFISPVSFSPVVASVEWLLLEPQEVRMRPRAAARRNDLAEFFMYWVLKILQMYLQGDALRVVKDYDCFN